MTDAELAARMLADGTPPDDVRAVFPNVDPTDKRILELAAWHRQASEGSRRLSRDYLEVRLMSLVDDDAGKCEHCGRGGDLDSKTRGRLLLTLARLRQQSR